MAASFAEVQSSMACTHFSGFFLTVSAVLIIDLVNTHFPPLWFDLTQFYNLYSLNIILLSADLFLFFAKSRPFRIKQSIGSPAARLLFICFMKIPTCENASGAY